MCGSLPGGSDGHPPFFKKIYTYEKKIVLRLNSFISDYFPGKGTIGNLFRQPFQIEFR